MPELFSTDALHRMPHCLPVGLRATPFLQAAQEGLTSLWGKAGQLTSTMTVARGTSKVQVANLLSFWQGACSRRGLLGGEFLATSMQYSEPISTSEFRLRSRRWPVLRVRTHTCLPFISVHELALGQLTQPKPANQSTRCICQPIEFIL